jgi:pimeloyl-ACP methyl ester carboxylesterase
LSRFLGRAVAVLGAVAAVAWLRRAIRRTRVQWTPPRGRSRVGTLAARVLGDDGEPIVLLHGLVSSGRMWGGAFDELADRHRLVVPDLLGFGRSPTPVSGYGPNEHAAAVLACVDEVAPGSDRFVVAAHSTGCLVAIHLAAAHPERVRAIVGLSAPLYHTRAEARALIGGLGPMARLLALDAAWSRRLCDWVCEHRDVAAVVAQLTRPDLPGPIARDGVEHTWPSYSETLERVVLSAEARPLLETLDLPVHLVTGAADRVAPPALLDGLAAQPNVTTGIWDGGHELPLLHPGDCTALIRAAAESS